MSARRAPRHFSIRLGRLGSSYRYRRLAERISNGAATDCGERFSCTTENSARRNSPMIGIARVIHIVTIIVAIAEIARDLFRPGDSGQSFSERQLFELVAFKEVGEKPGPVRS